jgi:hypothetical protein
MAEQAVPGDSPASPETAFPAAPGAAFPAASGAAFPADPAAVPHAGSGAGTPAGPGAGSTAGSPGRLGPPHKPAQVRSSTGIPQAIVDLTLVVGFNEALGQRHQLNPATGHLGHLSFYRA